MDTVERLQERRQIKLAKSILESAGYRVIKEDDSNNEDSKAKLNDLKSRKKEITKQLKDFKLDFYHQLINEEEFNRKGYEVRIDDLGIRVSKLRDKTDRVGDSEENYLAFNALIDYLKSKGWTVSDGPRVGSWGSNSIAIIQKTGVAKFYLEEFYNNGVSFYKPADIYLEDYKRLEQELDSIESEIEEIKSKSKSSLGDLSWDNHTIPGGAYPEYHADYGDYHITVYDMRVDGDGIGYDIVKNGEQVYVSDDINFKTIKSAQKDAAKRIAQISSEE